MSKGRRYKFKDLLFWAQKGMICIEDARDNSFDVITVREFLTRVRAINAEIHKMRYPSDRLEHANFVDNAIAAGKQARTQGSPDDPWVMADLLKRRHKSVLLAGGKMSAASEISSARFTPEEALLPKLLDVDGKPIRF